MNVEPSDTADDVISAEVYSLFVETSESNVAHLLTSASDSKLAGGVWLIYDVYGLIHESLISNQWQRRDSIIDNYILFRLIFRYINIKHSRLPGWNYGVKWNRVFEV